MNVCGGIHDLRKKVVKKYRNSKKNYLTIKKKSFLMSSMLELTNQRDRFLAPGDFGPVS